MIYSATPPSQYQLYGNDDYDTHVVRLLLEEKNLPYRHHFITKRPEFLAQLNPYNTLPILANREVALYELNVIFEYLEDKHKANPLLPTLPHQRAQARLLAWRLQNDWLKLGKILLTHPDSFDPTDANHAKKSLTDSLITLSPLFARLPFFMSEYFGWCDVLLAPLLWRLPMMGIELPRQFCQSLLDYEGRVFARASFLRSLDNSKQEYDHE